MHPSQIFKQTEFQAHTNPDSPLIHFPSYVSDVSQNLYFIVCVFQNQTVDALPGEENCSVPEDSSSQCSAAVDSEDERNAALEKSL